MAVGELTDVFYLSFGNTFVSCVLGNFLFLNLSSHSFLPTPHILYPRLTFPPLPLATSLLLPCQCVGSLHFPSASVLLLNSPCYFYRAKEGMQYFRGREYTLPLVHSAVQLPHMIQSGAGMSFPACDMRVVPLRMIPFSSALPFNHPAFLFS